MYLLTQEKHPVASLTTIVYQAPNAVKLKSNETDKLSISTFPLEVTVVTPVTLTATPFISMYCVKPGFITPVVCSALYLQPWCVDEVDTAIS